MRTVGDFLAGLPGWAWQAFRRVRLVTLAAVLVAAAVALAVYSIGRDEADVRDGSTVVSAEATPLRVGPTPVTYRVVYRVENRAGGDLVLRTEEVRVRRPFSGRIDDRPGKPPGGAADSVTVSRFGAFEFESARSEPLALQVAPSPPTGDVRAGAALEAARRARLVELRERRRVEPVARECVVYRLGGVRTEVVRPYESGADEYTDVCVDEAGFVLEEVHVVEGSRVVNRRLAVSIDESPRLDPDLFAGPDADPPPPDQGGGSVLAVDPDSRPPGDPFYELPGAPSGFSRRGRYAVIPPQAEAFADPLQFGRRLAAVVDVWVRGPDLVVVDQGGTQGRVPAFEPDPDATRVDAGALGEAELLFGLRASEVRVLQEGGRYVRVYGNVDPALLLDVARRLTPEPGGTLVYLDRPPAG